MSKKINEQTTTATSLKEYLEKYPNASLRKVSLATKTTYGLLLKKSKQPVEGEVYDVNAINWEAVDTYLQKRGVNYDELDWDALNEGPNRKGASLVKNVDNFKVGDKVYLRRDNENPYEILYKTDTHVVIMKVGTSEPLAWANNTFLLNGPVFEPRTKKIVEEVGEE